VYVDPAEFRKALGQFATGVTVVTCETGEGAHGATVNAFAAVSLDPPLVLVSLDRRSKASQHLPGRPFAVTVLRSDALPAALHFAGRAQPGLVIDWAEHPVAPRIRGGAAWFACAPWASYDGGDHVLCLGLVQEFEYDSGADPLVFHQGGFRAVAAPHVEAPWLDTLDSPTRDVDWWLAVPAVSLPAAG
jgi:flavin reductase (DIM6/NTAB) family NADH-FMN oxidoreductase RutF